MKSLSRETRIGLMVFVGIAALTVVLVQQAANRKRLQDSLSSHMDARFLEITKLLSPKQEVPIQASANASSGLNPCQEELARLRARFTQQAGIIASLQARLSALSNAVAASAAASGSEVQDQSGKPAGDSILTTMWGEDFSDNLEEATKELLHGIINQAYQDKQKNHPNGDDPNFVVSTLMLPESWVGWDVDNPRYMYDHVKQLWNIVYEANDGFETKRVFQIDAVGNVQDVAVSRKALHLNP